MKRADPKIAYQEVARVIDDFLEGKGRPYDWDDFISSKIGDVYLDGVRKACSEIFVNYPADQKGHYCNAEGLVVLRKLASEVRTKAP